MMADRVDSQYCCVELYQIKYKLFKFKLNTMVFPT